MNYYNDINSTSSRMLRFKTKQMTAAIVDNISWSLDKCLSRLGWAQGRTRCETERNPRHPQSPTWKRCRPFQVSDMKQTNEPCDWWNYRPDPWGFSASAEKRLSWSNRAPNPLERGMSHCCCPPFYSWQIVSRRKPINRWSNPNKNGRRLPKLQRTILRPSAGKLKVALAAQQVADSAAKSAN